MKNNIEHRMGKTEITVTSPNGDPLKNKTVAIKQTKLDFLFGSLESKALKYVGGELDGAEKERAETYFNYYFGVFNAATLPFYWGAFEPERGKPDTGRMLNAAKFLTKNGITLKGHPLCWQTVTAPWLMKLTNPEIMEAQLSRIRRDVVDFAGIVNMWDVVNEAVIMPIFKQDNGITRICKEYGQIGLIGKAFGEARRANPAAVLLLNDYDTSDDYADLIRRVLDAGIKIDAIGIQAHMHNGYWGVEKTMEILDRFSRFGLPLHFTENTIISGDLIPDNVEWNMYHNDNWQSTPEGEERQAKETVLHYAALFSHPLVKSITWWELTDGGWMGAPCGFITKDGRAKPVYNEIYKLINKEWRTAEHTVYTDENGRAVVSGFKGEYKASCEDVELTFKII